MALLALLALAAAALSCRLKGQSFNLHLAAQAGLVALFCNYMPPNPFHQPRGHQGLELVGGQCSKQIRQFAYFPDSAKMQHLRVRRGPQNGQHAQSAQFLAGLNRDG